MNARRMLIGLAMLVASVAVGCSSSSKATRPNEGAEQTAKQAQTQKNVGAQTQQQQMGMADKQDKMQAKQGQMGMKPKCPMEVSGTKVSAENTKDGVAMVFATTTGDVAELQHRVEWMAQHHNEMAEAGKHSMMGGMGNKKAMGPMPMTTAKFEKTDTGARVVYTPKSPSDVQALQQWMVQRVQRVNNGTCPLKYRMGKAQGTAQETTGQAAATPAPAAPAPAKADKAAPAQK